MLQPTPSFRSVMPQHRASVKFAADSDKDDNKPKNDKPNDKDNKNPNKPPSDEENWDEFKRYGKFFAGVVGTYAAVSTAAIMRAMRKSKKKNDDKKPPENNGNDKSGKPDLSDKPDKPEGKK